MWEKVMSHFNKNEVWVLPCKSQEFNLGPKVYLTATTAIIEYDYETSSGDYAWSKIKFLGLQGVLFTYYDVCKTKHIEAYDKIVVVTPSDWLHQLESCRAFNNTSAKHYRIFFDEVGCYEFIAGSIELPLPFKS